MSSDAPPILGVKSEPGMGDGTTLPPLGKRKRNPDDAGESDSDSDDDSLMIPEDNFIAPDDESDSSADEGDGNDEDDSENEMDENDVPQEPYSEAAESFPAFPFYDSQIANITKQLVGVPQTVLDVLSAHDVNSKHVTAQLNAARKLLAAPKKIKVRIGLLGDAGAGKSSLLNCITDIDDLAKSLSGGESCTCVPTEYGSAFENQRKAFAASIKYFDLKKIRSMLLELLGDYNLFVHQYDQDWDDEQRTDFKRAMQNALKTLRVLFCDLKQFSNDQVAEDYLESNFKDGSVNAIELLMESCEVKLKSKITFGEEGFAEFVQASTRAKLRDLVDPLTGAKAKGDKPALWPLVRQVIIGIRGSRVLENVTIVDLPGMSDTNTVRKEMTKQYIKLCDYLWIVAPMKRVVDDSSVFNLLATYGQRFQGKVAVICTHADERIDRTLANHLRDLGCEIDPYYNASQDWKAKKKEVTACKNKINGLRSLKSKKKTKQVVVNIQTLEDKLKTLHSDWAKIDATRFEFLVNARAAYIASRLQREMQTHIPKGSALTIFCISNLHYGAHKGANKVSGPRLSIQVTGIPALRAHALGLPAPLLMGQLTVSANHTTTVFLKGAHMWVATTGVERRNELLELVRAPQKLLAGRLQKHSENFRTAARDGVVKALDANKEDILRVALKKFAEKKRKHNASIRAFIRKDGNHSSKLCPKDCWNESFTRAVYRLVDAQGPSWGNDFLDNINVTKGWIIADMQRVLVSIGEQPCASVLPMQNIRELIQAQIVGIESIFDNIVPDYQKDFGNIALDMTQDSDKNYFSRSMKPIYDDCRTDSGTGVTLRSLAKLEDHLNKTGEASPFTVLERCAIKALTANDQKHINKYLMTKVMSIYESTFAAFDGMIKQTVEDPKEAKARLALKKAIPKIQANLDLTKKNILEVKQKYATILG